MNAAPSALGLVDDAFERGAPSTTKVFERPADPRVGENAGLRGMLAARAAAKKP